MIQTRTIMGMPVTLELAGAGASEAIFEAVFAYFVSVDEMFSTYKPNSEISRINQGVLNVADASADMRTIFALAEQTRRETAGYFDILHNGYYDPSGLVKGWAIRNAAAIVAQAGYANYYVAAGGDAQAAGTNHQGRPWRVGIQNPYNLEQIVKVLAVSDCGVATSGTYLQGSHIYNPIGDASVMADVVSLTVIGPDIYEADRFATAAFAMGRAGIGFVEGLAGFEGYMIDANRRATFTSGFTRYVIDA